LRSRRRRAGQPTGGSNGEVEEAIRKNECGEEEEAGSTRREASGSEAQTAGPQTRHAGSGGAPPGGDTRRVALSDGQ
jgi:hypothetical protein